MIVRYRDGAVPQVEVDQALVPDFEGLADRVSELVGRAELTPALEEIWLRVRRLNRYVDEQAPWKLAKEEGRDADLDRVLATLADGLRVVTLLLHAWIPERATTLLTALGIADTAAPSLADARLGAALPIQVTDLDPLFPKQQPTAAA
jgi:methionyl-tRNA synthetase